MRSATAITRRPLTRTFEQPVSDRSPGWTRAAIAAIALATVIARLPFLAWPMGSDEGGLLMIASQWHPGHSLYGDYWVDRPPLLVDVFVLADRLGGLTALRVMGLILVVASVLVAARVARRVGGSPIAAALVAGILLVNPLLGVHEVNGELIATPLLLGAFDVALGARGAATRAWPLVAFGAGALAAAAALIKQNEVDGFVLLAALVAPMTIRGSRRGAAFGIAALAGAAVATVALLIQSAARGTGPRALWDAVVTFRLDAAHLINATAPSATTDRLHGVLLALVASGAPFIVIAMLRARPIPPANGAADLRWPTLAVLLWETVSVVGGGSYWLHYLICFVPGLVLAASVATAAPARRRRSVTGPVTQPGSAFLHLPLATPITFCAVSALVTMSVLLAQSGLTRTDPVITWLREHRSAGQTAVVAFGHPDYLAATGLTSPYPELWSLPVRVRDPELHRLESVLAGPDRPDWVVTTASGSLGGWGLDADRVQPVFDANFGLVADLGGRWIYLDRSEELTAAHQGRHDHRPPTAHRHAHLQRGGQHRVPARPDPNRRPHRRRPGG